MPEAGSQGQQQPKEQKLAPRHRTKSISKYMALMQERAVFAIPNGWKDDRDVRKGWPLFLLDCGWGFSLLICVTVVFQGRARYPLPL
jgi:hypothetical protein